ncbi:TonB-dependent receptor [Sphingomonas sp. SRS2]|uniref:TonB-dependent receptor n=1 Tax=Sphingomonas sp. SRS2 TaxID=133190 RepID=UPI00061844CB|nr:TonB-dependent receptor [Sphingomonas sp. SRS2]KKC23880.1 TonB-dependent receptor [Sphingomonas sp. SRS2]
MKKLLLGCAVSALAASSAYAQSTGSIDFESEIVVTGANVNNGVAGVVAPDTSKSKVVLTQEFIARQTPGQTINDIINQLPGVSFQNNDPFGSAGGTLTIRGFDDQRISQTFDGVPLNDSGGYALYSNQQVDPELISQVNVNLGTTDVDSPTAAATGSTVNYTTRKPTEEFGVNLMGSAGRFDFRRIFGVVDTGVFTPWGTRAYFAASSATNDAIYGGYGKLDKTQYNGKIYQPIGDNGDFISLAGHYNQNRNNFFGSVPLRVDTAGGRVVGPDAANRQPLTRDERFYVLAPCRVVPPTPGVGSTANSCGGLFDYRLNPSNTGNVRIASKFTLSDKLSLTVDPSYQWVKANGGGTAVATEGNAPAASGATGAVYLGSTPYFGGVDLNRDGDILDTVRIQTPSQTQTRRYGVISSLRFDMDDNNTFRVGYSLDYARHRQTGETGLLDDAGKETAFPVNNPLTGVGGTVLQKRDRLSYAILNQFSAEYRGEFMDDLLTVTAGVRAPFFKRKLTNYCFTTNAAGAVTCFDNNSAGSTSYGTRNPYVVSAAGVPSGAAAPQKRTFKYDKILPTAGLIFDFTPQISGFANYSKGIQVPGTDNLYQSFYFPLGNEDANPTPETTDNFDLGVRYRSGKIQAQTVIWYTSYKDRLASSFDRDLNVTIYRNLGKVEKYGIDGNISYSPIPEVSVYAFGSYLKSKIKDDVALSATTVALTAGKRESGAPIYTVGGRIQGNLGPVELGIQAKRTGSRYINDQNLPVFAGAAQVYGAKVRGYTLVDLDARVSLEWAGLNDKTYFQLNVTNLFDKLYVGGFDGTLSNTGTTFANLGAPRTVIGTISIGF